MSSGWTQTKIVLGGVVDMLACGKCKRTPEMPIRYIKCGHFFCDTCIFGQSYCFQCGIPVEPYELQPYRLVTQLLQYCNIIINVIGKTKSEDLKSLAKAVHLFSAEWKGVVPETDSDSEDDVIESTPPGGRSRRRNEEEEKNTPIGTPEQSYSEEFCEQAGKSKALEPETKGFVSPTQFSRYERKNSSQPETAEFLDQSISSSYQRGENVQPETKGFVSPTQFSPHQRKTNSKTETKGFVSPSQSSSLQRNKKEGKPETGRFLDRTESSSERRRKNVQVETAGFVSPSQSSQRQKEKKAQLETVGFVSPSQFSPRRKKKNAEPESAGFVDQTQSSPHWGKKHAEPETAGFVDPTQFSPRQKKKNAEPETAGFVDPTQFSPRRKKKNAEPETAGFVDPTQFSPHPRKHNLQPKARELAATTDRNKDHVEQDLGLETVGYLDKTLTPPGRKKMRLSIKTRKFSSRAVAIQEKNTNPISEPPESDNPEGANQRSHDNLDKICLKPNTAARHDDLLQKKQSPERNATPTESTDFVDPTQFEKSGNINLQPETEGYRDSSQSPLHRGQKKLSKSTKILDSKIIDRPPKNIEPKNKNSGSSDEMDWLEEPGASRQKLPESNEDSILATESAAMDQPVCRNSIIPESLQNVENMTNYQNVPMEIEKDIVEKTILSKHPGAQNCENKIQNTDSMKRTISKVHDDSMENLESEDETPVRQFKRIKSLARSRRSKVPKMTQDLDSSVETSGVGRESSHRKGNTDENVVLDCCTKNFSVQDRTSFTAEQNVDERIDEMVEKTLTKRSRRTRNVLSGEDQKMSPIDSSLATEISTKGKTAPRKNTTKEFFSDKQSLKENRESESNAVKESAKSAQTMGEPTPGLRTRENFDKVNLDTTLKRAVENNPADLNARHKVEKSKTTVRKSIPKNINKRNMKGETPLHTACVKGHDDYVRILLEAGANPNTKDNANWTPLQEAVNLGHREICKMLLQAGASPNTPAMENRTALHDAAANDKLEEAALLLRYNANKNVYDKFGKRPINYAFSDEMRALLSEENEIEKTIVNDPCGDSVLDQSIIIPNSKVVVLPSNLNNKNRKLLAQLAPKLKVEVAMTFRSTVTHVVVETNDRNITNLTYDVMLAILQGKWILNSQWITISTDLNDISEIDFELFEVHGSPNPGTPTNARMNEEKQNPRLFNNCYFYFAIAPRCTWSYEKFEFTKESLTTLVLGGQGEILHREPDPEDVKDYKLTPFHVAHKPIHPLYKCSHYIIYMPGKDEPRVKYNMPHIKSLPVGWFLECIEKFTLVDPLLMGIS